MTNKTIIDVSVVGMENVKKDCGEKRFEFVLEVHWSNDTKSRIYRPHSMFFDLQGLLASMFKNEKIPSMPVIKFWKLFGKSGHEKGCKSLDEFCKKIIALPPHISEASIVLHFFDNWGTDDRCRTRSMFYTDDFNILSSDNNSLNPSECRKDDELPATPNEQYEEYCVIADYAATNSGEISLVAGQVITIIEKNDKGWWFIADSNGRQGWAPATYLESFYSNDEDIEDDYQWKCVTDQDGKGELYVSITSYVAENDDEVSYEGGEEIEVLKKSKYGWWKVRFNEKIGITPGTNLKKKDDPCIYESIDSIDRKVSITSKSGLYAVVRKAPPRRESVRSSTSSLSITSPKATIPCDSNFTREDKRLAYSTGKFSGGSFLFSEEEEQDKDELALPESTTRRRSDGSTKIDVQHNYTNVVRAPSKEPYRKSHGDVSEEVSHLHIDLVEEGRPRKLSFLEDESIYVLLHDFHSQGIREELNFSAGSTVKIMSTNGEWLYVSSEHDPEKQGWVPANYLIKQSDHKTNDDHPVPRPRPKPKPKPRPLAPATTENTPTTSEADAPKMPENLLSQIEALREYGEGEDLYDEPEKKLKGNDYPWYYGNISRSDSERLLSKYGRQREFLVRESQRTQGSYAISVKYCYRIRHFTITRTPTEFQIGTLFFAALPDLIRYYQCNALFISENDEPISLGNELPKENLPPEV